MAQSQNLHTNPVGNSVSEASAIAREDAIGLGALEEITSRERLELQLRELQIEIAIMQARFRIIKRQAGIIALGSVRWMDASAHDQLGDYPWLKLSGASLGAFLMGQYLRRLPFGLVALAIKPLLVPAIKAASAKRREWR